MNFHRFTTPSAIVRASLFEPTDGAREVHVCAEPRFPGSIESHLDSLHDALLQFCAKLGLPADSAVLQRLFLSDYANQVEAVERSQLLIAAHRNTAAFSVIQQPPLPNSKASIWAYYLHDTCGLLKERSRLGTMIQRDGLRHAWTTQRTGDHAGTDSASQTAAVFETYAADLAAHSASLPDHVVRTWVFVRDVDVNYRAMVDVRRDIFAAHGMNSETHYIASTGIEGRNAAARTIITFDAYAVIGLDPAQLRFLSAPDNLGPTSEYGVTFERGVTVTYADRSHVFISGTASIDPRGRTLHRGNIGAQLSRTLDNIDALLTDARASSQDVAQMLVYLRDAADSDRVRSQLEERFSATPYVMVLAPVCRPEWLVEVECIGIVNRGDDRFPPF